MATAVDSALPALGQGIWYLVRADSCGGPGSYDFPAPSQVQPRDAEIDASPFACVDCPHGKCEVGGPLSGTCNACVNVVCASDPSRCTDLWSSDCVEMVRRVCRNVTCSAAQGSCAHNLCAAGPLLQPGCDTPPEPPSCVAAVCATDAYCCGSSWDAQCVAEVGFVCDLRCN